MPFIGRGGLGGGDWSSSSGRESELQSVLGKSSNKLPSEDLDVRLGLGGGNNPSTLFSKFKRIKWKYRINHKYNEDLRIVVSKQFERGSSFIECW